jgi:hypothetical protein
LKAESIYNDEEDIAEVDDDDLEAPTHASITLNATSSAVESSSNRNRDQADIQVRAA